MSEPEVQRPVVVNVVQLGVVSADCEVMGPVEADEVVVRVIDGYDVVSVPCDDLVTSVSELMDCPVLLLVV